MQFTSAALLLGGRELLGEEGGLAHADVAARAQVQERVAHVEGVAADDAAGRGRRRVARVAVDLEVDVADVGHVGGHPVEVAGVCELRDGDHFSRDILGASASPPRLAAPGSTGNLRLSTLNKSKSVSVSPQGGHIRSGIGNC